MLGVCRAASSWLDPERRRCWAGMSRAPAWLSRAPPACPQAQGEWTEEEHALFLSTARAHGCGDKWGLFASYIPQRVGYQCSAYYRRAPSCLLEVRLPSLP